MYTHELIIESFDAHKDLETLRYSISTEQRSISQLEIESERILSTSNADAEKIFEMVQDIQEKITHNERILTQVSSSSEDYTVEVSQLQRLLIAINDHIGTYICITSSCYYLGIRHSYVNRSSYLPMSRRKHTFRRPSIEAQRSSAESGYRQC